MTNTSDSITITVMEAAFPDDAPACMIGRNRTWACPNIPPNAVIESDSTVALSRSGTTISLRMNAVLEKHHIVARLYDGGPILASTPIDGFWLQAGVDAYLSRLETYENSELWQQEAIAWALPSDVDIQILIFVGGVTFDDMTTSRWISLEDFDALANYRFKMIHPNSVTASTCHRIKLYENGYYLGEAYYAGLMFPEE